jgi:hypothetical protein
MRILRHLALAAAFLAGLPSILSASDWDTTALPRSYQYRLAMNTHGDVYAIGDSILFRSTDDGATWTSLGHFRPHTLAQSLTVDTAGAIFAGDVALGVFRSTDGGQHWSESLVTEGCNSLAAHPAGWLFAGLTYTGNGKVHRSSDGGATWNPVPLPDASGSFATECFGFGDQQEIYAGTIDGFYRSTDFGASWSRHNSGLLSTHIRVMAVAPDQDLYIHSNYSAQIDGLYRSTDRGFTWQRTGDATPYVSALVVAPGGDLFGTEDNAVYRSSDHGVTWAAFGGGISPFESFTSLLMTPGGWLLAGGRNVYRTLLTATDVHEQLPAAFHPIRNYPNPFNPSTTIVFRLDGRTRVRLDVCDLLGRDVATLRDEILPAGEHEVAWDARERAGGVYLVRVVTPNGTATGKMMLLR